MRFTSEDYDSIYKLTFEDASYAGYRPTVQESPNGDGIWDEQKKYAHIATKYRPGPDLITYYDAAFKEACRVIEELGFDERFMPDWNECCMRILDYPPGAGSAEHTDFDFLTIQLYREYPEGFVRTGNVEDTDELISAGIHFGEMAEVAGLRKAMPHYVKPMDVRQKSIVFFVLPHPSTTLITAKEWLTERYARSRR